MHWWVTDILENRGPVTLVSWIVWVIASVVLHELAHGWAAISVGDRTPIERGHMTLNPLVHMGAPSLLMFAIVGLAWGLMPVNPARFRGKHADAFVALAGPAMNLVLGLLATLAAAVWIAAAHSAGWNLLEPSETLYANLQTFFHIGATINLGLFVLNLLPIPPLDGASILGSFVPSFREMVRGVHEQGGTIAAIIVIGAVVGPLFRGLGPEAAERGRDGVLRVIAPEVLKFKTVG